MVQAAIVGVLDRGGQALNAEGLQRNALPAHLPPALSSTPFQWVTLDVRSLLGAAPPHSEGAAWACAYLRLGPQYSPASAVPLWAWLRQGGVLGLLLARASNAGARGCVL